MKKIVILLLVVLASCSHVYTITDDFGNEYHTNDFHIDKDGCIKFIDNKFNDTTYICTHYKLS